MEPVIDIGYEAPNQPLILVVDDENSLQTLIFDALDPDYRIVSAHNGREGLEKATNLRPAAILMDVMMPDMGGYDAVRLLQNNEITRSIPVVVMTAQNFDDSTIQLIQQEFNVAAFLRKPFRTRQLREAVKLAIAKGTKAP